MRKTIEVNLPYVQSFTKDMQLEEVCYRLSVSYATARRLIIEGRASKQTIDTFCKTFGADPEKMKPTESADVAVFAKPDQSAPVGSETMDTLVKQVADLTEEVQTMKDLLTKIDNGLGMIGRCIADGNESDRKFYVQAVKFFTEYKNNKKYGTW